MNIYMIINSSFPAMIDLMNEFQSLKQEVLSLKRNLSEVTSSQNELVHMVKSLKKSNDAKNFDMSKCCHTVCIIL